MCQNDNNTTVTGFKIGNYLRYGNSLQSRFNRSNSLDHITNGSHKINSDSTKHFLLPQKLSNLKLNNNNDVNHRKYQNDGIFFKSKSIQYNNKKN